MGAYSSYLKKKLNRSRIMGLVASAIAIVLVVLYFLKIADQWFAVIDIAYLLGMAFSSNVTCQDIKVGSPWQKFNAGMSVLFYILAVALMIYAFVSGGISF